MPPVGFEPTISAVDRPHSHTHQVSNLHLSSKSFLSPFISQKLSTVSLHLLPAGSLKDFKFKWLFFKPTVSFLPNLQPSNVSVPVETT
jgi:hypothetical protein